MIMTGLLSPESRRRMRVARKDIASLASLKNIIDIDINDCRFKWIIHEGAGYRGGAGVRPGRRSQKLHPRRRGAGHHAIGGEPEDQAAGGWAWPQAAGADAAAGAAVG